MRYFKFENRLPPLSAKTQMNFHVRLRVSMTCPTLLGLQYVDIVKCLYFYPLKNTLAAPETEKWIRFNA